MDSDYPYPFELPYPPANWLKRETQLSILKKLTSTLQINKKNLDIICDTLADCRDNNQRDQFVKDYKNKVTTLFYFLCKEKDIVHKIWSDSDLNYWKFYCEHMSNYFYGNLL